MNTCKFCFTAIPDDATYCPGCGAERSVALNKPTRAPGPEPARDENPQGGNAQEQPVFEQPVQENFRPAAPAGSAIRDTNGFSIAAFVCAFFVPIVGIVLSIIAIVQARSNEYARPLKGLAIWALIISILCLILRILLLIGMFYLFSGFFSNLYDYINGLLNNAIPSAIGA